MNSGPKIVRFGVFELDIEGRELRKSGVKIKLQDQPFQLLAILLEHRGEIVTRDDLRLRLWPDGTFVDFDHSLNASMNKLRGWFAGVSHALISQHDPHPPSILQLPDPMGAEGV